MHLNNLSIYFKQNLTHLLFLHFEDSIAILSKKMCNTSICDGDRRQIDCLGVCPDQKKP